LSTINPLEEELDLLDGEVNEKAVEDWLREVCYQHDQKYIPSDFALEFVNFIKLVNGTEGEENKTPVIHMKMLDNIQKNDKDTVNMCHRGVAKTTVLGTYLILYIATYGNIPGFGEVGYGLYVSDAVENGVKKMRLDLEFRWQNSEFLQEWVPYTKITDIRWEFKNKDGKRSVFTGHGAKALSLDSKLFTEKGFITIGSCKTGDKIFGADGQLTTITHKSEIFYKPMYKLGLADGRSIKVSEDHINSVIHKENPQNKARYVKKNLTTKELLELDLQFIRTRKWKENSTRVVKENLLFIENCKPLDYSTKNFPIDPYTLGLLLGDGSLRSNGTVALHGHKDDWQEYKKVIPYPLGKPYVDKRNTNVISTSIKGLSQKIRDLNLVGHGDTKFIPEMYLRGSIGQRLSLLRGLMDTDGTISTRKINPVTSFTSNSFQLVCGVATLVRSLGGDVIFGHTGKKAHRLQVKLNLSVFHLSRKKNQQKFNRCNRVAIKYIKTIPTESSQCIAVDNEEKQFLTEDFVRTHNTGVRGTREFGKRPVIAILDDLISDDDARSETVISSVEDTVYKAVDYALHPQRRKIIWSGTPFNAKDPLYKAVGSGAWHVNVYPICEHWPCTRKEFVGSWEDRFNYDYVLKQYIKAKKIGKIDTFNQELMLRIMSDEDRLITDDEINWYSRDLLLQRKDSFNYYITTDFATSDRQSADFSVISVWAYNSEGHWLWVDGVCKKQTMDININDLFRLAQKWKPQQVGIEISGQQGGFIPWIQDQMIIRKNFFNLAKDKDSTKLGIRPNTNKMQRFNIVVPWFKSNQMFFPREMEDMPIMKECVNELQLVSLKGMKSKHDDILDTISMLASMTPWRPSEAVPMVKDEYTEIWETEAADEHSALSSYVV
jgi:phage terminase large subunit-like protein